MKTFTFKHVAILVLAIVAGIAFMETSSPVWTSAFWREFLVKLLLYGAVSEIVVVILSQTRMFEDRDDIKGRKKNEDRL